MPYAQYFTPFLMSLFIYFSCGLTLPVLAATSPTTMIILPFKNITKKPADDWLKESFSENLTVGLGKLENLHLIERTEITKIVREQSFAQSALVKAESAPKLGRILGAKYVVLGNYQKIGQRILINVKVVDVETGSIDPKSLTQVKGDFDALFELQESLAQNLIQKLQIQHSQKDNQALKTALSSTRSTEAHAFYIKAKITREQLGDQNIKKAISLLKSALKEDPRYALAYAELAGVFWDRSNGKEFYSSYSKTDLDSAKKYAKKAIELAPEEAEGYGVLAQVLQTQGQNKAALKMARKALSIKKSTASILTYIHLKYPLKFYFESGKGLIVEQELKALGADLNDPQILFTLGGLYFSEIFTNPQADMNTALAFYEKAHYKNPHNPFFTFTLSAVHLLQGHTGTAKVLLNDLLKQNPQYMLLMTAGAQSTQRLMPNLHEVDWEKKSAGLHPGYILAYHQLATLYLHQEHTNPDNIILLISGAHAAQVLMLDQALEWNQKIIQKHPTYAPAYFQLSLLYLKYKHDPQIADHWFKEGAKHIKGSPNAAYSAGQYLLLRQKYTQAEHYIKRALNTWKHNGTIGGSKEHLTLYYLGLNTLGQIYAADKKISKALETYQMVTKSSLPDLQKGLAHKKMASLFSQKKDTQAAFKAYQTYLQLFPKNLQSQLSKKAYRAYFTKKELVKNPNNPDLLNDLGQNHLAKGELKQALVLLLKAEELDPLNPVIHYNLGLTHLNGNNTKQALLAFQNAVRLNPKYAKAYYNLGVVYYQLNDIKKAKSLWQKTLTLSPNFKPAQHALKSLN